MHQIIHLAILVALTGCPEWSPSPQTAGPIAIVFNELGLAPTEPVLHDDLPVFHRRAVFTNIPGMSGSHAATITALDDGELLAAWYSYEGPHELTGSAIYMSRRPVGSADWSEPWMHIGRPVGDGNPVLYSEADRVWLFQAVVPFLWSTSRIVMQISQDRGLNWSEPAQLPVSDSNARRAHPYPLVGGVRAYRPHYLQRGLGGSNW